MENSEIKIGQPDEWQAFQKRHPEFIQKLKPLYDTITKVFIREMATSESTGPADRVIFYLGRLAVEDFNEILLLCGNGYGIGGMKILRGLYERVVTLIYLSKNPDKVDDFLDYFKIHRAKYIKHAEEVFTLEELKLSAEEVFEIEKDYQTVKEKYQDSCKKCGVKRIRNSWSELDTLSMARKAGIEALYVPCFYHPTLQVHTTVASLVSRGKVKDDESLTFIDGSQHNEADFSLNSAHSLMICTLVAINDFFKLGLEEEIEERYREFLLIWKNDKENPSPNLH